MWIHVRQGDGARSSASHHLHRFRSSGWNYWKEKKLPGHAERPWESDWSPARPRSTRGSLRCRLVLFVRDKPLLCRIPSNRPEIGDVGQPIQQRFQCELSGTTDWRCKIEKNVGQPRHYPRHYFGEWTVFFSLLRLTNTEAEEPVLWSPVTPVYVYGCHLLGFSLCGGPKHSQEWPCGSTCAGKGVLQQWGCQLLDLFQHKALKTNQ